MHSERAYLLGKRNELRTASKARRSEAREVVVGEAPNSTYPRPAWSAVIANTLSPSEHIHMTTRAGSTSRVEFGSGCGVPRPWFRSWKSWAPARVLSGLPSPQLAVANISDLFVMETDGSGQTLLTRGSSATWSPDGKEIAFHASASYYASGGQVSGCPIRTDPGSATSDSDIFVPFDRPDRSTQQACRHGCR